MPVIPTRTMPSLHSVTTTARIFRDGNAWCATGPGFVDPQESAFGCGASPKEAYDRWFERALLDPYWAGMIIPAFQDFRIEQ
jgi:hypothetical protein